MLRYVKPAVTVFSAADIRNFKAAALSCPTTAATCASSVCKSSVSDHSCGTQSIACTKGASGLPR